MRGLGTTFLRMIWQGSIRPAPRHPSQRGPKGTARWLPEAAEQALTGRLLTVPNACNLPTSAQRGPATKLWKKYTQNTSQSFKLLNMFFVNIYLQLYSYVKYEVYVYIHTCKWKNVKF